MQVGALRSAPGSSAPVPLLSSPCVGLPEPRARPQPHPISMALLRTPPTCQGELDSDRRGALKGTCGVPQAASFLLLLAGPQAPPQAAHQLGSGPPNCYLGCQAQAPPAPGVREPGQQGAPQKRPGESCDCCHPSPGRRAGCRQGYLGHPLLGMA